MTKSLLKKISQEQARTAKKRFDQGELSAEVRLFDSEWDLSDLGPPITTPAAIDWVSRAFVPNGRLENYRFGVQVNWIDSTEELREKVLSSVKQSDGRSWADFENAADNLFDVVLETLHDVEELRSSDEALAALSDLIPDLWGDLWLALGHVETGLSKTWSRAITEGRIITFVEDSGQWQLANRTALARPEISVLGSREQFYRAHTASAYKRWKEHQARNFPLAHEIDKVNLSSSLMSLKDDVEPGGDLFGDARPVYRHVLSRDLDELFGFAGIDPSSWAAESSKIGRPPLDENDDPFVEKVVEFLHLNPTFGVKPAMKKLFGDQNLGPKSGQKSTNENRVYRKILKQWNAEKAPHFPH